MSAYPISTPARHYRARLLAGCALATALTTPAFGQQAFEATPTIVSGGANITQGIPITGGLRDRVTVSNPQVVIDWTPNDDATGGGPITILRAGNELQFQNNGDIGVGQYTVLNRIIPDDPSRAVQFDGHVMSQIDTGYGATQGGNIWFYSPGGIIAGATSRFDVGSLVLSANDIDTSGGLFGDDSSSSLAGTIRFRGDADSRSAVTIMPGAQINASGNYIALVAPRISQGGSINVEGGAALVAAESADITIPVSGGLFDIAVQTGSTVDAGGETTLTHSGTTETRDIAQTGAARRVYLMAVPKNDAVTMLVSGSLGYAPAVQAQLAGNGAIYLTTADAVSGDSPASTIRGTIHVTGGEFGARTDVTAQDITVDSTSASLHVAGNLDLISDSGNVLLTSAFGKNVDVGGAATLRHLNAKADGSSSLSVIANPGSTIHVGTLTLDSIAYGADESGYGGIAPTAARGGTLLVSARNSGIQSDGDMVLESTGFGGHGDDFAGAAGTGGIITIQAMDTGTLSAGGNILITANGGGGSGTSAGGAGTGGTIKVIAAMGSVRSDGGLSIDAEGFGGDTGYGGVSGDGVGGSASFQITNGLADIGQLSVDASGSGGFSDFGGAGGNGIGGNVSLSLSGAQLTADGIDIRATGDGSGGDTAAGAGSGGLISISSVSSSSIDLLGDVTLNANGRAGSLFGAGARNGTGGTIDIVNIASSFATSEGSLIATADGIGAYSNVFDPVTGRGGSITLTIDSFDPNNVESSFSTSTISLSADGRIDLPESQRQSVIHGNSGTGVGGTVLASLNGGPVQTGELTISASGTGANGDYGQQAGAGFAGRAELAVNGGDLQAGSISILAKATGGDGAFGESGYGEAGAGGMAGIGTNPFGAGSGAYLTGSGGSLSAETVLVSADATGGFGGDGQTFGSVPVDAAAGGAATGGTAKIATNGVNLSVGELSVSADGDGGDGGVVDYSNAFGNLQTANAGNGGAATGGSAAVQITGGTHDFGSVNADAGGFGGFGGLVLAAGEGGFDPAATGRGGNGGNGGGGAASIIFTGASLGGQPNLTADASGFGGGGASGAQGGAGGTGTGGAARVRFEGGTADLYAIRAYGYADGGSGGFGARLGGGNGGDAEGGGATFEAINSAVVNVADDDQFNPFDLDSSAFAGGGGDGGSLAASGFGGAGGSGGSALGGSATALIQSGAQASIPGVGGVENLPPSLIVSAQAGSGGFGGAGSASGNSGGTGGDGGNASAGLATFQVTGGNAAFGDVFTEATASAGLGGDGGMGGAVSAASGSNGKGFGGRVVLTVADGGSGQAGAFTAGDFSTDLGGSDVDGSLLIADTGTDASGGIRLGALYSVSFSNALNESESSSDYDIQSSARTIAVDGDVNLTANGDIRFAFQGTGGIASGTSLDIRSRTRGISITNDSPAATLSASLDARDISLRTSNGDIVAGAGTLLTSSGSIDIGAIAGNSRLANARAGDRVSISAGISEGALPFDATVTGSVTSNGGITIKAGRDTVIAPGAKLVADQYLTISSGDDIVIGSGALVRAANNPPPETGYGATDPLEQFSQLRLLAGGFDSGEEGNVASILIDGTVEAPNHTLFMSAGAVQAGPATQLTAGNLYVRLNNIPVGGQVPSNDGGQLTGACLQGSVCLGTANVNGIVRIGETEFEPIKLRLNGGIDGTDVLLRARSVELGQAGIANIVRAADSLTIESLGENLTLDGPLAITGGSNGARVAAFRSIDGGAAQVNAPGTLDLFAGNDITLAGVSAGTIRTVDFDGNVVNDGGITVPGTIAIGRITSGSALDLNAGGDIALDSFDVTGGATLTAANGMIDVATDASATSGTQANGRSISLQGANGLTVASANASAGDVVLATTAGTLRAANVTATGGITLDSGGAVSFDKLTAGGALGIAAQGDVTSFFGGTGGSVSIITPGKLDVTLGLVADAGAMSIQADAGIHTAELHTPDTLSLMAANGAIQIESATQASDVVAIGRTVGLASDNGLSVSKAVATAGGIGLSAGTGELKLGSLSATGDVSLTGQASVTFDTIAAGGQLLIEPFSTVTGGTVTAARIFVGSNGTIAAQSFTATHGDISLNAANGLALGSISASGTATLKSGTGPLVVTDDLVAGDGLVLQAPTIDITAQNGLNVLQADATAGDLTLTSVNGGIVIGDASATGALIANAANGLIAVDGNVSGSTVALTSRDIAIGSEAQLGSRTQTTALTLTSTADRLFVGDAPEGTGYRLDSGEFARIASAGDITIASAPQGATGEAFSFVDPAAANVVLGSLTFDGGQLGSNGTLLINSPSAIGVVGNLQFKAVNAGQTVTLRSASDIALAAETGLVTLKEGTGLSGTLRLEAQQVQALSTKARTEIAGLDLNAVRQRLGTNDQLQNDGGYFQAGQIVVRINRLAFIQNSGANGTDPNARRGFTTNSFRVESSGSQPAQLVLNGRIGSVAGADLISAVAVSGNVDMGSSFNGCTAGAQCGVPPGPPPEVLAPVLSVVRDQIVEEDKKQDEKEETAQASQSQRPAPLIQILNVPTSRFDPLIDQPVTGAGNEDLWMTPISPPQP